MFLRPIARPMLATWFIYDGIHAAITPDEHVTAARRGAELVGDRVPGGDRIPQLASLSDKQIARIVRVHGATTAVAGLFLATGKMPRLSAWTLAALTVPLAVANQPFGAEGPWSQRTQRFARNVGAIGAALIAGADYEGRPGMAWRVSAAREARAAARAAAAQLVEQ